jgi:F-type H+-transporting ATPase subunit a
LPPHKKTDMYRFLSMCILLFGLLPVQLNASDSTETEEFHADEYIMEHIVDSYGWHIVSIGGKNITISLPIILFDKGKLVCFMSSRFHNGAAAYKGYALGFTNETKGKIIKLKGVDADFTGELEKNKKYTFSPKLIDISISKNVCALLMSILALCWMFLSVAKTYKRHPHRAPKGFQGMMEVVIIFVRNEIAIPLIGEHKYKKFFPYLLTLFFFILFNNLMGLIPFFPGGANVTGNIAVTLILALITFFIVSFASNKNYWIHIINPPGVPWWLKFPLPLMQFIEFVGLLTKPFVLMIRLFANIVAGHIVILGFIGLIFIFGTMSPMAGILVSPLSLLFYVFMGAIELLVAFIQAFIFTMLTALYLGMAMEEETV